MTDDQGVGDVGCFGLLDARTPNLDRLAASGVRFSEWYANAPVRSVSRAAILTGKYPTERRTCERVKELLGSAT